LEINDKIKPSYFDTEVRDGGVVIVYKPGSFGTNAQDLTKSPPIENHLDVDQKIPLLIRIQIRDKFEAKRQEHLDKLNAATGGKWTAAFDFEDVYTKLTQYQDRIPNYTESILNNLVSNLVTKLKDDMFKQSFVASIPKQSISLAIDKNIKSYFDISLKDGAMVVTYKPDNYGTNAGDLAKNIEPILDPGHKLPLLTRLGIRDKFDAKKQEHLAKLDAATGGKWTVDPKWEEVYAALSTYHDRLPGYAESVFSSLVNNLVTQMKDSMIKEAFVDATPKQTIWFAIDKNVKSYFDVALKDGGLVVTYKPDNFGTNAGDVGKNIDKLL